jgi:FOG: Ankyrin repeat
MESSSVSLINSCQKGNLEKAKYALKEGADPNQLDEEGWNALHYASENGFEDIINILLENGADVNIENSSGFTPFQILMLCENYSPMIAASFIARGADVGSPSSRVYTFCMT